MKEMLDNLQVADEVVTTGGIIGRVLSVKEDTVLIETGGDYRRKQNCSRERWIRYNQEIKKQAVIDRLFLMNNEWWKIVLSALRTDFKINE